MSARVEYVPGEWRDLPRGEAGYIRPHTHVTRPTGLDWDTLTPKCNQCGTPSGQLADGARCPTCRGTKPVDVFSTSRTSKTVNHSTGRHSTYTELDEHQVEERFTPPARPAAPAPPAPIEETRQETTVTSPPFPPYIVDIAVVMRDTENHHDHAIRTARKAVANALMVLNRELTRYGSPAAPVAPAPTPISGVRIPPPRGRSGKLLPHHADLISRYLAGESTVQLATAYGVHSTAVGQYLRKHDIPTRNPGRHLADKPTGATA